MVPTGTMLHYVYTSGCFKFEVECLLGALELNADLELLILVAYTPSRRVGTIFYPFPVRKRPLHNSIRSHILATHTTNA